MQNRPFLAQKGKTVPINWRRGMLRLWMLASVAWIMGWVIYFAIELIRGESSLEMVVAPVVLLAPPIALLLFGMATRWAFQGFQPDERAAANRGASAFRFGGGQLFPAAVKAGPAISPAASNSISAFRTRRPRAVARIWLPCLLSRPSSSSPERPAGSSRYPVLTCRLSISSPSLSRKPISSISSACSRGLSSQTSSQPWPRSNYLSSPSARGTDRGPRGFRFARCRRGRAHRAPRRYNRHISNR